MLASNDKELLAKAQEVIQKCQRPFWHQVGAALRTKAGKTFAAVHLEADVGRIAVCAEAIAIGMAAAQKDTDIDTIVAVNAKGEVISPCGMCRELIRDYSPDANVIVNNNSNLQVVKIATLLPHK